MTPGGESFNTTGLRPDVACKPAAQSLERWSPGRAGGGRADALLRDPCVRLAAQQLLGAAPAPAAPPAGGRGAAPPLAAVVALGAGEAPGGAR